MLAPSNRRSPYIYRTLSAWARLITHRSLLIAHCSARITANKASNTVNDATTKGSFAPTKVTEATNKGLFAPTKVKEAINKGLFAPTKVKEATLTVNKTPYSASTTASFGGKVANIRSEPPAVAGGPISLVESWDRPLPQAVLTCAPRVVLTCISTSSAIA
jgi:hypothetical protein